MWVFDATPLIYLAKADQLDIVSHLDGSRLIPEHVYTEVVTTGIEHGYPDARRIEQGVENHLFEVAAADETPFARRIQQNPNLSAADVAVLALAKQREATAVMDEHYGRDVAETEDIQTRGAAYLILHCVKHGTITTETARETLDTMVEEGWFCAPNLYAKLVQKLESLE
ncbi:Predicted nucleic acid-binding protein, contains PIN domain [Halogranum amylolyticum]|uniref:Predicted nucleic acid-binding protein, contains PIN domain n=1 Tax=Halogranum amylolyticum TaxID=660520 RepID=A0A1H8MRL2_9EURY|nr:DUF3368 domain-containing protein [Halogranum amylolyticum]SEO20065.1 Predicted nucleic acid-binding protein, contains PIN domain [Halogranum amylolyticum]